MSPRFRFALASFVAALAAAAAIMGCTTAPPAPDMRDAAVATLKQSFKPRGQATLDRLVQDEAQALCSAYVDAPLPPSAAARIEAQNMDAVAWPADGKYMGDWRNGEKIAQEGRGMQYSDDPAGPVGGNCYACHQLSKTEIAYGTIGPSLLHFAARGTGAEVQRYAYGKIYNAQAYLACSNMPRFGSHHVLTQEQIKDLVALLLDPKSPVNQP